MQAAQEIVLREYVRKLIEYQLMSGRQHGTAASVVYCDVTERNRVAMSRHRHNVASRHYDGSRRYCYSGVN
jgi:hypothetical protein